MILYILLSILLIYESILLHPYASQLTEKPAPGNSSPGKQSAPGTGNPTPGKPPMAPKLPPPTIAPPNPGYRWSGYPYPGYHPNPPTAPTLRYLGSSGFRCFRREWGILSIRSWGIRSWGIHIPGIRTD